MPDQQRRLRWIVRLLPPSFREEYEQQILRTWQDEIRDPDRSTPRAVWPRAVADTLRIAPGEHAAALIRNIQAAVRQLRRAPAFALTAVLTLGLGTGATTAVFSLVNAVLLRPLPFHAPERVGLLWAVQPSGERTWLSFPELDDLQRQPAQLRAVAGMTDLRLTFSANGAGEELQALAVSHGMLGLLGVTPALGRDFARADDRTGAAPVVLLSDAFWRTHFAADPSAIGATITLNDRGYTIVGILPSAFELLPASSVLPGQVDVWLPLEPHLASRDRTTRFLHGVTRLPDGLAFQQADAELRAQGYQTTRGVAAAYPGGAWTFTVAPFEQTVLGTVRTTLRLLFALVLLVLVMACVNVAMLLLARGEARRVDLALRTALGAGPARLAGELLAEALVLAACGAGVGLALAVAVPPLLRSLDPGALPRLDTVALDRRVMAFVGAMMLLTVVLFAAAPLAERMRLRDPGQLLASRSGGRNRRAARTGRVLSVLQTALATTVLIIALLVASTLVTLQRVDLGFVPANLLTARLTLSPRYPPGGAAAEFFDRATAALAAVPGVTGAAAITQLPLSGAMLGSTFLAGSGPEARRMDADLRGVTPRYFEVMGTPLLDGRFFDARDSATAPGTAIVDESFARRLAADGPVIGTRIRWFRQPDVELEIVGVVRAVRHRAPAEAARDTVYRPHHQYSRATMFVIARTAEHAAAGRAAPALRAALRLLDPSQPVSDLATMERRVEGSMSRLRLSLLLTGALAGLALALGGVGLYGVLSFGVAQRRREFGVRMTLGARPASVRALVLREGLALTAAGCVLGVAGAAAFAGVVRATLGEASGATGPYLIGVAVVLVSPAVALWVPARRASGADPMIVLRAD